VRVEIDGQLFTEYVFGDGASRPYCYPVLAPDGTSLTRDFPQKETPGEDRDHPWHRSIWFAHSMVNGVDFWNEGTGDVGRSPKDKGRTVNDGAVEIKNGPVGTLRARNRLVAPDGRLIATDERTLRFHAGPDGRFIDYEITMKALPDQALLFGDNKDGTMATRLAQWMTMPHKQKGQEVGGKGHIVTAKGDRDAAAWGKRAEWCDYNSQKDGKTYGVAIFDHPAESAASDLVDGARLRAVWSESVWLARLREGIQGRAPQGRLHGAGWRQPHAALPAVFPSRRREGGEAGRALQGIRRGK
jgi:hypothetical protein